MSLAGFGVPQDDIAKEVGVSIVTLLNHYRRELDLGIIRANARVRANLYKQATKDTHKALPAIKLWHQIHLGFSERAKLEVSGKDGGPIEMSVESARERIQRRIARLAENLPLLPPGTERDIAETQTIEAEAEDVTDMDEGSAL